jgi:phospholipid/cholesterol/gamma-HCH transport system ATP-binding protein
VNARPVPGGPVAGLIRAEALTLAFGTRLVQRELNFEVQPREVLAIIGGSGCGKSTVLRALVGLHVPQSGRVWHGAHDFYASPLAAQDDIRRTLGVMFQAGALFSSMTVGENVMLPLELNGQAQAGGFEARARDKLALVGLADAFDQEPAALSGGMKKRAAIARALVLEPAVLLLDEPSAGLDPLSSAQLDDLILGLRDRLGTTVVMVTHELDSLFAVADRALFLSAQDHTMTALGSPRELADSGPEPVRRFLRRERAPAPAPASAPASAPAATSPSTRPVVAAG